jgi:hypothetical protein
MILRVGEQTFETEFAWPSGSAHSVLAASEPAMGAVRAGIAAKNGVQDPFHVRSTLANAPDAVVSGCDGAPLTRDAVDARLVGCPGMVGVLAFQPLGPLARAVPADPSWSWLRWRGAPPGPARVGAPSYFSAKELGEDERATFRCSVALPRGSVAIGSDYGVTLWSPRAGFEPFPWPAGARRENRRVEAMLATPDVLYVATQKALFTWDYKGEPRARKYPSDAEDGYDDLLAIGESPAGPVLAWRTRLEGGKGPADVLCFARDPSGVLYAGTRTGEVHVVDGGGPIRSFAGEKMLREGGAGQVGRPVRHLAWADGRLWVGAAGGLHSFDGARWESEPGEPGALAADSGGRLWMIRDGKVYVLDGGSRRLVDVPVSRPWSILGVPGAVWVGGVGGVVRVTTG